MIHADTEQDLKGLNDSGQTEHQLGGDNSDEGRKSSKAEIIPSESQSSTPSKLSIAFENDEISEDEELNQSPKSNNMASHVSIQDMSDNDYTYASPNYSPFTPSVKSVERKTQTPSACSVRTEPSPKSSQRSLRSGKKSAIGSVASVRTASPPVRQSPSKSECETISKSEQHEELSPPDEGNQESDLESQALPKSPVSENSDHDSQTKSGNQRDLYMLLLA